MNDARARIEEPDPDFIRYISEDLQFLADSARPEATESDLRRSSVVLRNLLIHGDLIRCWRMCMMEPKQPTIVASRLDAQHGDQSTIAFAGGGQRGNVSIAGFTFEQRAFSPAEVRERATSRPAVLAHPFKLNEFVDSAAAVVRGVRISRLQLIAFAANKKGGAHYDRKRKKDEIAYKLLDEVAGWRFGGDDRTSPLPAVYFELLSIGQFLTTSPDIERLTERCASFGGLRQEARRTRI